MVFVSLQRWIWFLLSIVVIACSNQAPSPFQSLSPAEFVELASSSDMIILDVRTSLEIEAGMIPGAVQLDYNRKDFKERLDELDRDKIYGVYCGHGGRSLSTLEMMQSMQFANVYDLDGGYTAYLEYLKK